MITNSETTVVVTLSNKEVHAIINEIDNIITKLSNSTVMDINEIKTLLTLKNSLVLGVANG